MSEITRGAVVRVGVDLAKRVFQVLGVQSFSVALQLDSHDDDKVSTIPDQQTTTVVYDAPPIPPPFPPAGRERVAPSGRQRAGRNKTHPSRRRPAFAWIAWLSMPTALRASCGRH